jgi:hypothetical protein
MLFHSGLPRAEVSLPRRFEIFNTAGVVSHVNA